MEFEHNDVRRVVEEDRLSSLPDDLIHMILSCLDMKFAVQMCLLSLRWKPLWKSTTQLNFSSDSFCSLSKFANFVTHVLSHRNHHIEVSSVKLNFHGANNQAFVRKIANYAFSHNVPELTLVSNDYSSSHHGYPPWLFSSQSLKHFTLTSYYRSQCITSKTPWDFPALTTLHFNGITLRDNLFINCVNLKNLTLERFMGPDVFDIITPQLSNLRLIHGRCSKVINMIAPQLENLTIYNCLIEYLNAPPGISNLFYRGRPPCQLSKNGFHSLNKVSISLSMYNIHEPYKEEDARKTINMFQEVHSARYLTLNEDIVECLSSFPDLLLRHSSPFSNLKCLTFDYKVLMVYLDAHKVTMSSEVKNFLLENSPSATIIMNNFKVPS